MSGTVLGLRRWQLTHTTTFIAPSSLGTNYHLSHQHLRLTITTALLARAGWWCHGVRDRDRTSRSRDNWREKAVRLWQCLGGRRCPGVGVTDVGTMVGSLKVLCSAHQKTNNVSRCPTTPPPGWLICTWAETIPHLHKYWQAQSRQTDLRGQVGRGMLFSF